MNVYQKEKSFGVVWTCFSEKISKNSLEDIRIVGIKKVHENQKKRFLPNSGLSAVHFKRLCEVTVTSLAKMTEMVGKTIGNLKHFEENLSVGKGNSEANRHPIV